VTIPSQIRQLALFCYITAITRNNNNINLENVIYKQICSYIFQPIAFDNLGTLNSSAVAPTFHLDARSAQSPTIFVNPTLFFSASLIVIALLHFNSALLRESFVCEPDKCFYCICLPSDIKILRVKNIYNNKNNNNKKVSPWYMYFLEHFKIIKAIKTNSKQKNFLHKKR